MSGKKVVERSRTRQRQRRIIHGGCGLRDLARIGLSNQILRHFYGLHHPPTHHEFFGLSSIRSKSVVARFDGGMLSSNSGVLALAEVEKRLRVAERLARCIDDPRCPDQTVHSLADMIGFSIRRFEVKRPPRSFPLRRHWARLSRGLASLRDRRSGPTLDGDSEG